MSEEVRVVDPLTGGEKGVKPERYSLIPSAPLAHVARVYGFGEKKYSKENWRKGYSWSHSIDALGRHIEAFRGGEWLAPDSGHPHLAHAVFHLFALMWWYENGKGTDDRGDILPPSEVKRGLGVASTSFAPKTAYQTFFDRSPEDPL